MSNSLAHASGWVGEKNSCRSPTQPIASTPTPIARPAQALLAILQLGVQPSAGKSPVSLSGCVRYVQRLGGFGNGHAGKVAELHELAFFRPTLF